MPDIMKMKPKESDGVDSVIIVDGVPVVGSDRYGIINSKVLIRGSVPLSYGSGSFFFNVFFAYYLMKAHVHNNVS